MKRNFIVIAIILLFAILSESIYSVGYKNFEEVYNETYNRYSKMEEFQKHLIANKTGALAMVKAKANWVYKRQFKNSETRDLKKRWNGPNYPGNSFPRFKQKNYYYCGPASALTALYFQGTADRVHGRDYIEKQDAIAADADTTQDGTIVYKLTDAINNYSRSYYSYDTRVEGKFLDGLIYDSLYKGNAPIVHARMEDMGYYRGSQGGHYISIVYYDWKLPADDKSGIHVMDNNRDDRFFGVQHISFEELYRMINKGRYIISATER